MAGAETPQHHILTLTTTAIIIEHETDKQRARGGEGRERLLQSHPNTQMTIPFASTPLLAANMAVMEGGRAGVQGSQCDCLCRDTGKREAGKLGSVETEGGGLRRRRCVGSGGLGVSERFTQSLGLRSSVSSQTSVSRGVRATTAVAAGQRELMRGGARRGSARKAKSKIRTEAVATVARRFGPPLAVVAVLVYSLQQNHGVGGAPFPHPRDHPLR